MRQRKTLNPVIWFQYGCWWVSTFMMFHKPYYPLWLRIRLLGHYPPDRHHLSWKQIEWWQQSNPDFKPTHLPLPWYIGQAAMGPFVAPWNRVQHLFRKGTGGRTHRCEFTDPEHGALYGHKEGPFMNALFDRFIENISADEE